MPAIVDPENVVLPFNPARPEPAASGPAGEAATPAPSPGSEKPKARRGRKPKAKDTAGGRYRVSLKYCPTEIVEARDPSHAVDVYKAKFGIHASDYPFEVVDMASEEPDLQDTTLDPPDDDGDE